MSLAFLMLQSMKGDGGVGYADKTYTSVIEGAKIDFTDGMGSFGALGLVAGKSYAVKWDGAEYTCKGVAFEMDGTNAVLLGNASLYGFADTGEPFVVIGMSNATMVGDLAMLDMEGNPTGSASHTFGLSVLTETIHTIDPKFIPPMDSLTINGTDGKRYKLTVNNGSISVAEVV